MCASSVWELLTKQEIHTGELLLLLRKWITYHDSIRYDSTFVVATADDDVRANGVVFSVCVCFFF